MAYRETGRTTQRHRALDVVFEAELVKQIEVNIDYIL